MNNFNFVFKFITESLDAIKPINKVIHTKPMYKAGTMFATPSHEYSFETTAGNKVVIQIVMYNIPQITFYVNGTTSEKERGLDKEILSNITYMLVDIIKRLKFESFTFESYTDHKDTKTVRNLDGTEAYTKLKTIFDRIMPELNKHIPKVKKVIRDKEIYDIKAIDIADLQHFYNSLNKKQSYKLYDVQFQYLKPLLELGIITEDEYESIPKLMDIWHDAYVSNTSDGLSVQYNRRLFIYKKILDKYFINWKYEIHGSKVFVSKK